MAGEKGKNIPTGPAPPMNPPPRSSPFVGLHGCQGDDCTSDPDTWPLHHVIRDGVRCSLCCSCILLSHRSLYCCRCFCLITSASASWNYDVRDVLMAPPAPTVTCQVCRDAVAHLPCLHPAESVFICPACTAAQNRRPFTYAPPSRQPLHVRHAKILLLGARIALALLNRHADAARAAAERLSEEALAARTRAYRAVSVALNLRAEEDPSLNADNELLASEEGREAETDVEETLLVRRDAMPPLTALTIGTEARVVPTPPADVCVEAAKAELPRKRTLNLFDVKEAAMAGAEVARASSPPAPQTLQLFPIPNIPRTLQLFKDKIPDDDEEK